MDEGHCVSSPSTLGSYLVQVLGNCQSWLQRDAQLLEIWYDFERFVVNLELVHFAQWSTSSEFHDFCFLDVDCHLVFSAPDLQRVEAALQGFTSAC